MTDILIFKLSGSWFCQAQRGNSSPLEGETADLSQAAEMIPLGLNAPQAFVVLLVGAFLWIYLLRKRV